MCPSCGSAGNCSCSSVVIPIGPQGPAGPQGVAGANGIQGVQGLTGPQGAAGATPAKYANTFTYSGIGGGDAAPIIINLAAIISCNALINTCVSTPTNADFIVTVWFISGSQYKEVTNNSSYISSIIYDTAANQLTITPSANGIYRIVVIG